jgi:hypothetical protein
VFHRRNVIQAMSIAIILISCGLAADWAMPQDAMNDKPGDTGQVQSGYAIVTPTSAVTTGLVVFETFGEHRMSEVTQAGVLPSDVTTHCILYVSSNGRLSKNLGVAIANPGADEASVTLTLLDEKGFPVPKTAKAIKVAGHNQTAQFVTELFADQPSVSQNFTGTLDISSSKPVAVIGLRFRGQNFSTLPVTSLAGSTVVPKNGSVGGSGAIILAHVATGGGWATEIVIVNTNATDPVTVRADLFDSKGAPLLATLNGTTASSFVGILIPPMGVVTLSQDDDK